MGICPIYKSREKRCPLGGDVFVNPCEKYNRRCGVMIEQCKQNPEKVKRLFLAAAEANLESDLGEVD